MKRYRHLAIVLATVPFLTFGGAALAGDDQPVYEEPVEKFTIVNTPGDNWRNVMTWCVGSIRFALSSSSTNYGGHGAAVAMVPDPACKS